MLLNLNPSIFHLGPIDVRWYGLLMALSFLLGTWYLLRKGTSKGLSEDTLLNLALLIIVGGVVGARLMYVLVNNADWFIRHPMEILKIWQGGLAWHGGLLGALILGGYYARRKGISVHLIADLCVPGIAIGYALIRIANIFNQEVLGRFTDFWFGRWPAQPIAALIALVLLLRYFYLVRHEPPVGYQFWSFIFYHQLLRGLVEETMREMPLVVGNWVNVHWGLGFFTLGQMATLPIMALAYWFMLRSRQKAALEEDKNLLPPR